ncbi:hypothetical protein IV203_017541 [Nitzschia inconspicua]|uniref:Uncharacterized protein n=1 Tax=Nitzschia inconspicua TaxID=303405 RepID=A0A9K3P7M0_9STRA|nr:hypothetical protein IV203_017541 [Nitzschia inconspicua]
MVDGTVTPTQPLLLYKHSVQHRYNKQKPGLDMNTELSDRVAFNSKGSFESKHVFRMLDAILVNSWRAHHAVFDVARGWQPLQSHQLWRRMCQRRHGCTEEGCPATVRLCAQYAWCACARKNWWFHGKSCYEVWHERKNLALEATKQRKRLLESREQEDADAEKRRKLSANANSQKKSPSKSPGPSQDAQFQEDGEQPDEDELVEEDEEDELEGDNTDEQDIEEEEIGEQYYDDVYFSSDIDSLEDSTGKRRRIQNNCCECVV